eukprot:TRINITY_DN28279_c0_g1_i1.p1 TRINITY_DN28279_c0_g1~~TRINITY_DN28279_c0_g1_i1.p1  ORF type:complete len:140 (+),score=29.58 TRINITY_DN28279_c0_g1_i1:225-644(+)
MMQPALTQVQSQMDMPAERSIARLAEPYDQRMEALEAGFRSGVALVKERAIACGRKRGDDEKRAKDKDVYEADDASHEEFETCGGCERRGGEDKVAVTPDSFVEEHDVIAVRAASRWHFERMVDIISCGVQVSIPLLLN